MTSSDISYHVIGDQGGSTFLGRGVTAPTDMIRNGVDQRFKTQKRRGYIVKVTGDNRSGQIEMLQAVGDDTGVSSDEAIARFRQKHSIVRGNRANTIFRNTNGN